MATVSGVISVRSGLIRLSRKGEAAKREGKGRGRKIKGCKDVCPGKKERHLR